MTIYAKKPTEPLQGETKNVSTVATMKTMPNRINKIPPIVIMVGVAPDDMTSPSLPSIAR
jgi:hypothetical protein